jgi:hypothetical protein
MSFQGSQQYEAFNSFPQPTSHDDFYQAPDNTTRSVNLPMGACTVPGFQGHESDIVSGSSSCVPSWHADLSSEATDFPRGLTLDALSMPSLHGDFYHEQNNVTRGVTLDTSAFPAMQGDFYQKSDDIMKSLTLDGHSVAGLDRNFYDKAESVMGHADSGVSAFPDLQSDFYKLSSTTRGVTLDASAMDLNFAHDSFLATAQELSYSGHATWNIKSSDVTPGDSYDKFSEEDEAPAVPDDTFFKLEKTTIAARGRASEIGNGLIQFFEEEVRSKISKVRRAKFAIKAEVYLEDMYCMVKVRVYKLSAGEYTIELQRRSGDCIGFNRLFSRASQYMKARMHESTSQVQVETKGLSVIETHFLKTLMADVDACDVSSLAPLLDLAETSGDVMLQAEAMVGLAQAARDSQLAVHMLTPQVFAMLHKMAQVVCFSVAEPLSRLVYCLAALPQAQNHKELHHLQASLNRFVV